MRTSRFSLALVTAAVALAATACGSSSTGPTAAPPIPQYAGSWAGTYTVTGCTQSGGVALANICGLLGGAPPYSLNLTQNGRSVTGSFALGTIQFTNTGGTIGADGSLGLQGTAFTNGTTIITTWALNMPVASPTGTVSQVWTNTTLSGQANVVGTIATALRTAVFAERAFVMPQTLRDAATAATIPQP